MTRWLVLLPFVFAALACSMEPGQGTGTVTATSQAADTAERCSSLVGLTAPDTVITSATLIHDREDLPPFCQVDGTISQRVRFTLRLRANDWNGKFVVAGCGGFCGALLPDKPGYSNSINEAVKLGFAAMTTDSGHEAPSWDTDWAMDDPVALDLYAGAWMPLAVASGRAILQGYYAEEARRTYFSGCSNGGRLGLMAAQRYPTLFDGIAAGGAIFDLIGNAGVHGLWLLQSTRDEGGRSVINRASMPALHREVLGQCDGLDGVHDGVVSRPDHCHPQLDRLQCRAHDAPGCFSAAELASIRRLYQGATADGAQLYPGINPGSESLWPHWVTGTDEEPAWGERAAEGLLRLTYRLPSSELFNPHHYNLADELDNLQRLAPVLNATDPDLSAFAAAGGKLFYYHGLADPLILSGRVEQYYEEVVATLGRDKLDAFARFVMIPGHGHCWEKPGQVADDFHPLAVIDRWVESGKPPDHIIAVQKNASGETLRSRKLCPLPQLAQLRGSDPALAASYVCVRP